MKLFLRKLILSRKQEKWKQIFSNFRVPLSDFWSVNLVNNCQILLMFDCVTTGIFNFMIYICLQLCLNVSMTNVICSIIQIFNILRDLSICLWNCFFFNGAKSEKKLKQFHTESNYETKLKHLKLLKLIKLLELFVRRVL